MKSLIPASLNLKPRIPPAALRRREAKSKLAWPLALALGLLLLALTDARAQTPDDYFHGGAQNFLSNNIPGALEVVTNGLQRFPEDQKLQKLYELLNQQKQQQQNQQDQKQQEQDKKDQQKQEQKQDQQKQDGKQDQQSKNDQQQKDKEAQKQKEQDKKDQQQPKSGDQAKDKPEEKPGEQQQVAAHAMTPQEAKQLLDAQKGDEQVLQFQPQGEPKKRERLLKDW
jgi:outer membrane biosynthesis protein TonB